MKHFGWLILVLCLLVGAKAHAVGSLLPSGYFHVSGNQILSNTGAPVKLACAGFEPEVTASIIANMPLAGFNCMRIDVADATTCPGGTCNFTSPDAVVSAATAAGLKVIISHHSNEGGNTGGNCGSQQANGIWYDVNSATVIDGVAWQSLPSNSDGCGAGTTTYARFKANSIAIAAHYAGNSVVIGFDLWNEPLYNATSLCSGQNACPNPALNWGGGNGSDIKLMYQAVGAAIETADPGVLIIVEGPIQCTGTMLSGASASPNTGCFTDLSKAGSVPVTVTNASAQNVVVYSIHDYPNDTSGQNPDSGPSSITARNVTWGYLVINGTAPVWVGEGGSGCAAGAEAAWCATYSSYSNGTAVGGPTFTAAQQGIGMDWWFWGNQGGNAQIPGYCTNNACTTFSAAQSQYVIPMQYTPTVGETISVNHIVTQTAQVPFAVSGTVSGLAAAPTLQCQDAAGGYVAVPNPVITQTSSTTWNYSFVNGGLAAVNSMTVSVRDANNTSISGTSNTFQVQSGNSGLTGTPQSPLPSGFYTTSGNQIVTGAGTNVKLACSGYNEPTGNNGNDMIVMRTQQGFNCARVPYYDKTLCPGGICNFTSMDAIVAAATAHSMKIIIDHHANEGVDGSSGCLSQQANGLWYDVNSATVIGGVAWNTLTTNQDGCGTAGTVTYAQFKANWVAVATHYAGNQTVIGFDLDNEPLKSAAFQATKGNWGGNNGSDARLMCNDTGSAVETAAPGALIICEGLVNFTQTLTNGTAMAVSGGTGANGIMDLSQAASLPVNGTGLASHVVYSIHDYPNDISAMVPDFGPSSVAFRTAAWGYLVKNGTAPVWIGEMGADLDGTNGTTNLANEQAWASTLTQYMNGSQSGNGGPSFTGCQQPIGGDWWNFGNNSGQSPNGTLNADGTNRAGQQTYWGAILYTTCPVNTVTTTTWNPTDQAGMTLTGSNLVAANGSGPSSVRSSQSVAVGNVCWEITANTITSDWDVGLVNSSYVLTSAAGIGGDTNSVGLDPNSTGGFQGTFFANALLGVAGSGASANGEVVTQCATLTTQQIWSTDSVMRTALSPFSASFSGAFGNAPTAIWNNSATANPATGVGGLSFSGLTGPYFIAYNNQQTGGQATLNATGPFTITLPTGFAPFQPAVAPISMGKIIVINLAN